MGTQSASGADAGTDNGGGSVSLITGLTVLIVLFIIVKVDEYL